MLSILSESGTDLLSRAALLGNLVFVDAATKVYNRSYFNIQLDNEIARARRESKSLALVIYDIDDFKSFNTQYGYEGGNDVLARVARLLKSGLRPFDSVARWGGREFALILTAPISETDARMVTARLRRAVEKQIFSITGLEGKTHNVTLTISGGAAIYPDDAITAADLWRSANASLMWSKEHGKNQVSFYSDLAGGTRTLEEEPRLNDGRIPSRRPLRNRADHRRDRRGRRAAGGAGTRAKTPGSARQCRRRPHGASRGERNHQQRLARRYRPGADQKAAAARCASRSTACALSAGALSRNLELPGRRSAGGLQRGGRLIDLRRD
jgi:diguanylate cyclase (GGDEF)-like protein